MLLSARTRGMRRDEQAAQRWNRGVRIGASRKRRKNDALPTARDLADLAILQVDVVERAITGDSEVAERDTGVTGNGPWRDRSSALSPSWDGAARRDPIVEAARVPAPAAMITAIAIRAITPRLVTLQSIGIHGVRVNAPIARHLSAGRGFALHAKPLDRRDSTSRLTDLTHPCCALHHDSLPEALVRVRRVLGGERDSWI